MPILHLAWKSLLNRRLTVGLTLFSIALSVCLLIGVERVRIDAKQSFANTISGTDLIVGARSGGVQLLLYSVFRIGNASNNISWQSYQEIAALPDIAWSVPVSLGDSHRGYRVMGTTQDYFTHYRYARTRELQLQTGEVFDDLFDVVIGAEVAAKLGYQLGDPVVVAHGADDVSFARHDDKPFKVSGILKRTGTPVDRTLHISLQGIEAIHADWKAGTPIPGLSIGAEEARNMKLTPKSITAALVGLDSRIATFSVQRYINEYKAEPLTAILPGVALSELWNIIGIAENALLIVSGFVVIVGLFGMLAAMLTSLNERRREMAILRSVGARPLHIFALIMGEAAALTAAGIVIGLGLLYVLLASTSPLIEAKYGIDVAIGGLTEREMLLTGAILVTGCIAAVLPAYRAYKLSLADGLTVRT